MKKIKKSNIIFCLLLVITLVLILPINNGKSFIQSFANIFMSSDNPNYNKLKVTYVDIISRTTGTAPFNTSSKQSVDDGSVLSDNNGNDVSSKDLYVRTNDSFTYTLEVGIGRNELTTDSNFFTTGGTIRAKIYISDPRDYLLDNQSWMKTNTYNPDGKYYEVSYDISKDSNPIGGTQRLVFTFKTNGNTSVLDESKKPRFEFYMDGNDDSSNTVAPVVVKDSDNLIITGRDYFDLSVVPGKVNYKSELNGVSGNYISYFIKVTAKSLTNFGYKGVKMPSKDLISNIKLTYKYRDIDNDNSFTILDPSNPEHKQILDNIKIVSYGISSTNTPGFVPREDLNFDKSAEDLSDPLKAYSSGTMTANYQNGMLEVRNSGYFYTKPFEYTVDFIIDGVEMFFPRYDDGNANYDYNVDFKTISVSEVDGDNELYSNTQSTTKTVQFKSKIDGNISYEFGNPNTSPKDISIAFANTLVDITDQLSSSSGPFYGMETLVTWDSTVLSFDRLYHYSTDTSITNVEIKKYGVYKQNPTGGLTGDDKINAAIDSDFDWYNTESEATSHGKISAAIYSSDGFIGFGQSLALHWRLKANSNVDRTSDSSIVRRKTKLYTNEEKTQSVKLGYDTDYIKGYIDENGNEVMGSPTATGQTILFTKYKSNPTTRLTVNGQTSNSFNVSDEYIDVKITPTIRKSDKLNPEDKDTFNILYYMQDGISYVPGSANIEPEIVEIYDAGYNGTYTKLLWRIEDHYITDDFTPITFKAEISPYIPNNANKRFVISMWGDTEFAADASSMGAPVKGYFSNHSVGIVNLAGQSIRKKTNASSINVNETVIVNDTIYNISQETLNNINTIQEIPTNNDNYGSHYNGNVKIKINSIIDGMKIYYSTSTIDELNLPKDSHDRYLPHNIDFENDSRWVEINSGEYVPTNAKLIGSHYGLLSANSDFKINYNLETSGNSINDIYCMKVYGSSSNLTNAMESDNRCITVGDRKISGMVYEKNSNNSYEYYENGDIHISDTTVILLDENKQELKRMQTDAEGKYSFNGLNRGIYYIKYEKDPHYDYIKKRSETYGYYNNINNDNFSDPITQLESLFETSVSTNINIGIKKKKYNLTVHYYQENTTTSMDEDFTATYVYNTDYVAPKSNNIPSKYEIKSTVGSTSGNISEDTEVIYYYGLKNSKVIVKYIDKDTNTSIVVDDELNKKYDDQYSVSPKTFEHYNYDSKEGDESGTVANDEIVVKYFYTKKPATLTVHHYYDGTTNSICDDIVDTNKHHTDPYSTSACTTIPQNYEYKSVVGSTSGTINTDSLVVTYYYQKKNSTISNTVTKTGDSTLTVFGNKVKYKLSINHEITDYIGNGTLTIVDTLPYHIDESNSTLEDGTYDSENKTITWTIPVNNIDSFNEAEGKYLVSVEKNIELKYSDLDPKDRSMINTVNSSLVLDNNSTSMSAEMTTSIAIKGKIKVKYIDDEDKEIIPSINGEELVGTIFTAEAKEFTGYELRERPTNESVEYTVEDQELVYKYEHIKYNVIIKADNDGGEVEGNEVVFYGEDSSDGKLKIRAKKGFVIKSITINGETYEFDGKEEVILDKFTNVLEDKIIEVSFEQVINASDTEANSLIKLIAIALIIITTYFIFKKRKELFNK